MNELKICNLNKKFHKKDVLKDINLVLKTGIYGLIGPNGAGKTTLFRCLAALYDCEYKEISINQISIAKKEYAYCIGYLPQAFGAFKEMSVEGMLEFFANMKKIEPSVVSEEIEKVLIKTNLLTERKKKISTISGGMLRRLGVAQAILGNPKVVILDEPTVGLDPEERQRFRELIKELGKKSIVLLSTHIIDDVKTVCDTIIIMNKGEIYACDTSSNIKNYAQGHVYLCDKNKLGEIKGNYEVVRSDEQFRIIATEKQNLIGAEAEIEDGYLCYIKQIISD